MGVCESGLIESVSGPHPANKPCALDLVMDSGPHSEERAYWHVGASDETDSEESSDEFSESTRKRRKFTHISDKTKDELPPHMRHVRTSEKLVRDIYECLADLEGM